MLKTSLLRLTCCLIVAASAVGQSKKVNLKNAGHLIGTITEREGQYIIQTRFGAVPVPKEDVISIEDYFTPKQEYEQRFAAIDPANAEDHFDLGKWAFEEDMLQIAQKELKTALELREDYEKAALLLRQFEATQDHAGTDRQSVASCKGRPRLLSRNMVDPRWLLTDEEIARIRIEELWQTDRVLVNFKNNVLERFIGMMQGRHDFEDQGFARTFRGWPRVRKVDYMLDCIGRERDDLRKDIVIRSDPRFMGNFRTRVWPIVARYCGSADCHGGTRTVGGFRLLNISGRTTQVDYTNFLLIDGYRRAGLEMINRDFPDTSLLLQYGLLPDLAQHPHPVRIAAPFRNRQSVSYRRVMEWIESLKGPPHPKYDVKLRVPWATRPKPAAASQPVRAKPAERTPPA